MGPPVHVPVEAVVVRNQLILSLVVQFALEVPGEDSDSGLESGYQKTNFHFSVVCLLTCAGGLEGSAGDQGGRWGSRPPSPHCCSAPAPWSR